MESFSESEVSPSSERARLRKNFISSESGRFIYSSEETSSISSSDEKSSDEESPSSSSFLLCLFGAHAVDSSSSSLSLYLRLLLLNWKPLLVLCDHEKRCVGLYGIVLASGHSKRRARLFSEVARHFGSQKKEAHHFRFEPQ
jgi:hypothetical protein